MTRSGIPQSTLALLVVVLTAFISFGQDGPSKEAPPKPQVETLGPGDHTRTLTMGGQKRTYLVHVPKGYDPKKRAPVVLALHGAAMNGSMMVWFSGLNKTADKAGFIVVYPSGTGAGPFLTWNAGGFQGKMAKGKADDVAFLGKLLDDLGTVVQARDHAPTLVQSPVPAFRRPNARSIASVAHIARGCRNRCATDFDLVTSVDQTEGRIKG